MKKHIKLVGILGAVFVSGFLFGYYYYYYYCNKSFKLINYELGCDDKYVIKKHEYGALKSRLKLFINDKREKNEIKETAVYFRDLYNGPILGINEHINFFPASLFKVPYLMTYLKFAEEEQPDLLDKKLKFKIEDDDPTERQFTKPREKISENVEYTVEELLRRMIVYSDDRSLEVLENYLKQISPDENLIYENSYEMGVISNNGDPDEYITVKSYASIFRLLYNASFLNKEMSEKALSWLTETDYTKGLVAGIPIDIKVAHKFGEFHDWQNTDLKQLHDCGIVYFPGNPYLLCIMTRGHDYNQLANIIGTVSKMVYEEVDSRKL